MKNKNYIEQIHEDSKPVGDTYTDEQLESAGITKVNAYIRTKQSKNALRVKKSKEKKAQQGIKQLNIQIPDHKKDDIKRLAEYLRDGGHFDFDEFSSSTNTKKSFFNKILEFFKFQ